VRVLPMETGLAVLEEGRGAWCDQFQGKSVLGTHDQGRRPPSFWRVTVLLPNAGERTAVRC